VLAERGRLAHELGDPVEIRAERDGLTRAIRQSRQERHEVRDQLAKRELLAPGAWVREALGERPGGSRSREAWENGVRQAARYRTQYDITDAAMRSVRSPSGVSSGATGSALAKRSSAPSGDSAVTWRLSVTSTSGSGCDHVNRHGLGSQRWWRAVVGWPAGCARGRYSA